MAICAHSLAEKETECADGVCPICLRARVKELEKVVWWAHDVGIRDDEYQGKNAALRSELLQKAKLRR